MLYEPGNEGIMTPRRGFTIRLKRLKPRSPDLGEPQKYVSKDNFQHFYKQLYLYFCFGSTHFFTLHTNQRSLQKDEREGLE